MFLLLGEETTEAEVELRLARLRRVGGRVDYPIPEEDNNVEHLWIRCSV